jgi:hypothetical protein
MLLVSLHQNPDSTRESHWPDAGSAASGMISKKRNRTPELLIVGSSIATVACGLLSTLSHSTHVEASQYAFQALLGFGLGLYIAGSTLMMSIETEQSNIGKSELHGLSRFPLLSWLIF